MDRINRMIFDYSKLKLDFGQCAYPDYPVHPV